MNHPLQDLIELIKLLKEDAKQVRNLVIDYSCQDKDKVFATQVVNYDEDWLLKTAQKCEEYWLGHRFAEGYWNFHFILNKTDQDYS